MPFKPCRLCLSQFINISSIPLKNTRRHTSHESRVQLVCVSGASHGQASHKVPDVKANNQVRPFTKSGLQFGLTHFLAAATGGSTPAALYLSTKPPAMRSKPGPSTAVKTLMRT
ncbi:hypothetical protein XENORESO_014873 [Xenotaenia resolanae]|uniref:Uncharacterized protein n=1 Tax=Xenotaenia resolanae TaxID=208358 RepID=A0ABV0VWV2_9TELE